MSDATWKIRQRKNGPQPVSGENTSSQDQFELLVTAKSEHRPGIVRWWRGRIKIDQSGIQHVESIFLVEAGEANCEGEKATAKEIHIYTQISHENDPSDMFTEIAKICDENTQEMERHLVEQEKRERRNNEQLSATLLRLAELEDEGTHDAAPSREGI